MWHPLYQFGDNSGYVPPVVPVVTATGGGYVDLPSGRRRTRKERDELREQLGIIPKKAAAIIKREALRQAPIVDDADDARIDRMVAAIERTGLKYRVIYEELLREQIALQMQDDEEAAVLLLM